MLPHAEAFFESEGMELAGHVLGIAKNLIKCLAFDCLTRGQVNTLLAIWTLGQ